MSLGFCVAGCAAGCAAWPGFQAVVCPTISV